MSSGDAILDAPADESTDWGDEVRDVIEAANGARTLYAVEPATGLAAVGPSATAAANAAALTAQAQAIVDTWGSGRVVLPAGETIPCGPLGAWPDTVQLAAVEGTILDFGSLTGTQTAVSFSGIGFAPAVGVQFKGPGKTSTTTGLDIAGQDLEFTRCAVREFGTCVDLANEDTYFIRFNGGAIGEATLCVDLDLATAGTSNAGERHEFTGVTFFNSTTGLLVDIGGGSLNLNTCSIDFCGKALDLRSGHTFMNGGHIESADTVSTGGYLVDQQYNALSTFNGPRFIMAKIGAGGLRWIINPAHGPYNYGFGRVTFVPGCRAYFYDSNGTSANVSSDELVFVSAGQTTATIESPFVHKWGPVTALPAWNDGTVVQSGITVRPSVNVATGVVTVTASSAPATNALPVRVQF